MDEKELSAEVNEIYTVKDESLVFTPKDDDKDRLEVEIGDTKEPTKFMPQVKIKRWDNEVNFSVRLNEPDLLNKTPTTEKEKIVIKGDKKEAYLYDIPISEEHPEGGFEFEVVLKEKPTSNKIEFSIEDKDVEYFYQPELTQEEIDNGCKRPENVIGSYAVYAKSNKVNYVGGKEYKVGKVGHIFRPKIIDSAGTEVWGELHIENGILSVTIPQEFLDKAVYPIRHAAGLTFGNTSSGTARTTSDDYIRASRYTGPSGSNEITEMKASVDSGSTASDFQAGIYLDSDDTLVDHTEEVTNVATGKRWISLTFSSNPTGITDVYYLLSFWCGPDFFKPEQYYDLVSNTGWTKGLTYSVDNWPSPISWDSERATSIKISLYCIYTASAGEIKQDTTIDWANVKKVAGVAKASIKEVAGVEA